MLGLFICVSCLSLMVGAMPLSTLIHDIFDPTSLGFYVLWEIRFPRLILASLVGFALGLGGAALQGFLRNPLADPCIVGVSSMAALGAVSAYALNLQSPLILSLSAICSAGLTPFFFYGFLQKNWNSSRLILAGLILTSLASALIPLILHLSQRPYAFFEAFFWLFGSFADHTYEDIFFLIPFVGIGVPLILRQQNSLNVLSLGEDTAQSLGINPTSVARTLLIGIVLSIGASVAVVGMISFVGLIAPHVVRARYGEKPGDLLLPAAWMGATLTVGADILVRLLPTQGELKIGVMTSLIGAPLFLSVLMRRHDSI